MKNKILTISFLTFWSPLLLAMKGPNLKLFSQNLGINKNSIGLIHIANESTLNKVENNQVTFSSRVSLCFLINQNTAVTTAHTVEHFTQENKKQLRTYCEFETETGKCSILIKGILIHPQYYSDNVDLALIYLAEPYPQTKYLDLEQTIYDNLSNFETLTVGLGKHNNLNKKIHSIVYSKLHYYAINSISTPSIPMPPNFFLASQYIQPEHSALFLKDQDSFAFKAHGSIFAGDACRTEPMDSGGPIINPDNGKVIAINMKGLSTPYKIIDNTVCIKDTIPKWDQMNGPIYYAHKAIGLFLPPYVEWIKQNIK